MMKAKLYFSLSLFCAFLIVIAYIPWSQSRDILSTALISPLGLGDYQSVSQSPPPGPMDKFSYLPFVLRNPQPIVWILDGMRRIRPTTPPESSTTIVLYAARNENEPFQIAIRGPSGGLTNVNVTASDLIGPAGARISRNNISLYREHFIYLQQGSSDWQGSNRPEGPGWYPEPLIPFVNPATGNDIIGATLDATPFNVAEGENQVVWVDIKVPSTAAPGRYQGEFVVTSSQGNAVLNITLNVWNFVLPVRSTFPMLTQMWNAPQVRETYIELLKHRVMLYNVNSLADEEFFLNNYGWWMVSTGFWSGASIGACSTMDTPPTVEEVKTEVARHHAGLTKFAHYADEIWDCPEIFPTCLQWARNLRAGGAKPLLAMYPVSGLLDADDGNTAADIWVMLPVDWDAAEAGITAARAKGNEIWASFPLVQDAYSPKWTMDFAPINFPIFTFISYSLGVTGNEYWVMDYWPTDPWNNITRYGPQYPGEGHMVYPGSYVGVAGVCAGMRLKWVREGIEDYEYLKLLEQAELRNKALVFAQMLGRDWQTWTKDPALLYQTRKEMGDLIEQTTSQNRRFHYNPLREQQHP